MALKVFEVDEGEYWAATSAEEATATYLSECGGDPETMQEFGAPKEVPDSELDRLMITEVDEPGQPKYSFRAALAEMKGPGFIATDNY